MGDLFTDNTENEFDMESFPDTFSSDLVSDQSIYEECVSGDLVYLKVIDVSADTLSAELRDNLFLGFSSVGIALMFSLGAAVIIRMLWAR